MSHCATIVATQPVTRNRQLCPIRNNAVRVGDHRGYRTAMKYVKQRMSMRSGNARYSACERVALTARGVQATRSRAAWTD